MADFIPVDQLVATADDVRECVQRMGDFIRQFCSDGTTTSITPQLLVMLKHAETGAKHWQLAALMLPFNEHEEKVQALRLLGRMAYESSAPCVPMVACLGSEAWLSVRRAGVDHCEPRHDPARREVAIVMATDFANKHPLAASWDITRGQGDAIQLGECHGPETTKPGGLIGQYFAGWADAAQSAFGLKRGASKN